MNELNGNHYKTFTCFNCKKEYTILKKELISRGHKTKGKNTISKGIRYYCKNCAETLNIFKNTPSKGRCV